MKDIVEQHVFIVDDEPKVLQAVSETLRRLGVKISCFSRASACFEQLQSQECDLLITDLKMPEMDGIELLKRAKQLVPWLPVLILTGYGSIQSAVEAMKSGAVDFVEKPLIKNDFLEKITTILQQSASANTQLGESLTHREIELLKLILAGKTNREMATLLNCSQRTIDVHCAHLMKKCGVDNVVGLVKRAATMGLVELPAKQTGSNANSYRDVSLRK